MSGFDNYRTRTKKKTRLHSLAWYQYPNKSPPQKPMRFRKFNPTIFRTVNLLSIRRRKKDFNLEIQYLFKTFVRNSNWIFFLLYEKSFTSLLLPISKIQNAIIYISFPFINSAFRVIATDLAKSSNFNVINSTTLMHQNQFP